MAISPKDIQGACLVVAFFAECRYHNGTGYEHHPAFRYKVLTGDATPKFSDSMDYKNLNPEPTTAAAVSASTTYTVTTVPGILAKLIEEAFDGSG